MTHTPAPWKVLWKHDTHKVKRDKEGRILGDVIVPFEDYCHARDCVNSHDVLVAELRLCKRNVESQLYMLPVNASEEKDILSAWIGHIDNALTLAEKGGS